LRPFLNDVPNIAECPTCCRAFTLSARQRSGIRKGIIKRVFCCSKCYFLSTSGSGNPKWRGGKCIDKDGYICIFNPEHPYANKRGYVYEHRLVMESVLGRYLAPEESVHHIDGSHNNNIKENLMLMSSESDHRKLHVKYRTYTQGRFLGHKEGVVKYV